MPKVHLYDGLIVVQVRYLRSSRTGVWCYYRKVPLDLRSHYGGKLHILKSLGTRDLKAATKEALRLSRADDGLWQSLRSPLAKDLNLLPAETREAAKAQLAHLGFTPGERHLKGPADWDLGDVFDEHLAKRYGNEWLQARHDDQSPIDPSSLLNGVDREAWRLLNVDPSDPRTHVLLSDALARYLADKAREPKFERDTTRVIETVFSCVGDLPLESYTREHARTIRDTLAIGCKSSTVERRLDILIAVFNHAKREFHLKGFEHPFAGLPIQGQGSDTKVREPFTTTELVAIASACRAKNDDRRHILALQLDTGARLGEIVALRTSDVNLDTSVPYIHIRPYGSIHTLKTKQSERRVPLIMYSLWAAQRAIENARGPYLFPRYTSDTAIKATHASNTLNQWLREHLKLTKTTHSLRHSMQDRLRDAGVPVDIREVLLGHGSRSVGERYGQGFSLEVLRDAMTKVSLR